MLIIMMIMAFAASAFAGVNINRAELKELEGLPGIGKVKAQAIIDYRAEHGAFENIENLTRVKGIGLSTVEKLRDQITVDE